MTRRLAIGFTSLLFLGFSQAETNVPDEAGQKLRLGDTVVVATGHESEIAETPYAVHRLDGDQIRLRLQAPVLSESLDAVAGVMLQKTGRGMTSPYLRGFTSQRTVLIADGMRLNNSFFREGPNQYWNQADIFFYRDVEVMMGPASVLYGSDAVGGVVYARSTALSRGAPGEGFQWHGGDLTVRYASAERSLSEHIEAEGSLGDRLTLRLGLTRQDFGDLVAGGGDVNENSGYEQWGGNFRLKYWIDDDQSILFGYDHFDQDDIDRVHRTVTHIDYEGTLSKGGATDLRRIYDHDRKSAFARYELRNGTGPFEEIDAQLTYTHFSEFYVRHRDLARADYRPTDVETAGFRLRLQTPSSRGVWNYGVQVYHDWVATRGWNIRNGVRTDLPQGLVADDARYLTMGAYIRNEADLTERLSLTTGLRYDYAEMDAGTVAFSATDVRSLDGSWDAVTGSLRLMYRALRDDNLNLFAGASQGFRAPNLSDATREDDFGGGEESPTADLAAEKFLTLQAGIKHLGEQTSLELTLYHTFIEDRIGRLKAPATTKRNLDNGYIQGIECSGEYWPVEVLGLFGKAAWQYGSEDMYNNRDYTMGTSDYPMSRMHPLTAEAGVRWKSPDERFWAECAIDMAAEQDRYTQAEESDNRFPPGGTPGYAVVHLRGGAQIGENTEIAVAVENICDKEYRIHGSGINEPGRNFIITLQQRF
jgi:hemoglobin/transferrin/lactoferrin receptor protein